MHSRDMVEVLHRLQFYAQQDNHGNFALDGKAAMIDLIAAFKQKGVTKEQFFAAVEPLWDEVILSKIIVPGTSH